jgi:hypothetical protein
MIGEKQNFHIHIYLAEISHLRYRGFLALGIHGRMTILHLLAVIRKHTHVVHVPSFSWLHLNMSCLDIVSVRSQLIEKGVLFA